MSLLTDVLSGLADRLDLSLKSKKCTMNTSYFTRSAKALFLAVISVLTFSIFQNAEATIYYVKTTGVATNNGLSWDSTKTLQSALDVATAGDTIWVASAVYTPSESPDGSTITARNYAFHWNKDLKIFGGFDGTETKIEDRDFVANKTELKLCLAFLLWFKNAS